MLKTVIVLLLSLSIGFPAMAETCSVPTKIKQGEASPCDGYVINPTTEERIRTDLAYKDRIIDNLTKASDLQADLIRIQSNQVNLYQGEMDKHQEMTMVEKAAYFGLGALVTGAMAYVTVQSLRH
jgi:hypothetical protein